MSFRFKDQGPMGSSDPKFDDRDRDRDRDRMMGVDDKLSRDDMDGDRGPRGPFGRGRRLSPSRDKSIGDRREFDRFGRDDIPPHGRDRSPLRSRFDDRISDRFKRDDMSFPRRDDRDRDRDRRDRPLDEDIFRERMSRLDDRGRFDGPSGMGSRYDIPDDPLMHRPLGYPSTPGKGFFKHDMMKPNECEIIVVNKQQRSYSESVEQRLKNLGIQVDLLFLKDEALLVQTIDDIARRGSLYAIVISPLNETHRSVTLNILYGTPQEHRNMPLDDSLKLIARNFHDHIRSQRELMDRDKTERGMYAGYFPADREIQFLLRLLADGRQLSLGEIETVIRYLTERRDKMKGATGETSGSTSLPSGTPTDMKSLAQNKLKDDNDIAQKEKELQNRIMHIMEESSGDAAKPALGSNVPGLGPDIRPNESAVGPNKGGTASLSQNQSVPANSMSGNVSQAGANVPSSGAIPTSTPSTYINFDNPSVKKALDSLMQSGPNLLKSLASTTASASQSIQSTPSTEQSIMGSDIMSMQRGLPGLSEKGPAHMGGPRGMGDMGPERGRSGGIGDMGSERGRSGGMGDMGSERGRSGGMGDMGPERGRSGGMGDMGSERGRSGGMGDMGSERGRSGGMGDMGHERGRPGGMGGMGLQRGGPGGMSDMGSQRGGLGGMSDINSQRGIGGMNDMSMQRGLSSLGDMGLQRGGSGGMSDIGSQRGGPDSMSDIGSQRGLRDMGSQRGVGGIGDMSDMGLRGGPGNMGDMGFKRSGMGDMGPRGLGGIDDRGKGNMSGNNMSNQRGPGGGNMGMSMQRGPGGMNEGNMGSSMAGHLQDSSNMGRSGMGPGPRGMGPNSQFQGSQGMFGSGGPNIMGNRPPFMSGRRY